MWDRARRRCSSTRRPATVRDPGRAARTSTRPVSGAAQRRRATADRGQPHVGRARAPVGGARRHRRCRLDLEAIGDADGESGRFTDVASFYVPEFVEQVRDALDDVEERGLPARFVLLGLCSGAYWALHTALRRQPRVGGADAQHRVVGLGSGTAELDVNPSTSAAAASARGSWRRIVRGQTPRRTGWRRAYGRLPDGRRLVRALAAVARRRGDDAPTELRALLDRLRDRGQRGSVAVHRRGAGVRGAARDGYLTPATAGQICGWPTTSGCGRAAVRTTRCARCGCSSTCTGCSTRRWSVSSAADRAGRPRLGGAGVTVRHEKTETHPSVWPACRVVPSPKAEVPPCRAPSRRRGGKPDANASDTTLSNIPSPARQCNRGPGAR